MFCIPPAATRVLNCIIPCPVCNLISPVKHGFVLTSSCRYDMVFISFAKPMFNTPGSPLLWAFLTILSQISVAATLPRSSPFHLKTTSSFASSNFRKVSSMQTEILALLSSLLSNFAFKNSIKSGWSYLRQNMRADLLPPPSLSSLQIALMARIRLTAPVASPPVPRITEPLGRTLEKLIPTPPPVPDIIVTALSASPHPSLESRSSVHTKQFSICPLGRPAPLHILPPGEKRFVCKISKNLTKYSFRFVPVSASETVLDTRSHACAKVSSA